MLSAFVKRTALTIVLLFVVCGLVWLYSPHRHFIGVLAICYGFFIGWIAAWFSMCRYSRRQLG
jgi:hypothetical protein